jgi:hypothetical protein
MSGGLEEAEIRKAKVGSTEIGTRPLLRLVLR